MCFIVNMMQPETAFDGANPVFRQPINRPIRQPENAKCYNPPSLQKRTLKAA
ncbi:hypothetical protein [Kingella sp. (in: b-proteobacteria)]|uniref:hypothetical protein n=1 Tax=Kingella sp. (in: b-proteobacteria) TaxID=2020713 RepID=UPI0026DBADF3|nr:hypothetical protein [Kingella sp. (in: b-proteobacteria)]MDO4656753.1 hypothetical protein [Kingella sp. (in: b-proteobacteria)]